MVGKRGVPLESILIVEDNLDLAESIAMCLRDDGYRVTISNNGGSAIERIKEGFFNVVIIDIRLPDMDGLDVLKKIKERDQKVVCIIITGFASLDAAISAIRHDVYDFLEKPFDMEKVRWIIKRGIEQQRLIIKNEELVKDLTQKNIELNKRIKEITRLNKRLKALYIGTIASLVSTIEAKDHYTEGHSKRVTDYTMAIAGKLRLSRKEKETLKYACQLHDIGKIGIKDHILSKPGILTSEEMEEIKKHPSSGAQIVKPLEFLDGVIPLIKHHHERYAGSGYPKGLKMEDIPFGARIIAVADAFDAMISERPYRKTKSIEEAIKELKENAGTQFDPKVVEAFVKVLKNKEKI